MFPHHNIHNNTWTFPDGKIHNWIDYVLTDNRWLSYITDIRSVRGADCNIDQYLVVAKVRQTLSLSKHGVYKVLYGEI
jgi:hypothetical protein